MRIDVFGVDVDFETAAIRESDDAVRHQLGEYLRGDRERFDLTIDYPETFTGEVMRQLREIPYGETRQYAALADDLDTAPRAVGGACARNPLPVVVPCHRVVGVDSLVGYQYPGLKSRLLDFEGASYPGEPLA